MYTVREYIDVSKQIKSVCKVANSPVMTHVNETIDGATTVRTFGKICDFEDRHWALQDHSFISGVVEAGLGCWLDIKLKQITVVFVAASYAFCVWSRAGSDEVLVGLMMGYLIELQWNLHKIVKDV